ncbi:MAG: putative glycoside hydrolase [Polyangiales bacterium]
MQRRRWLPRLLRFCATVCALAALWPGLGRADRTHAVATPEAALRPVAHGLSAKHRMVDPLSEEGQRAHGLYFNAPMQHRLGAKGIARVVRNAGMNAAVLDLKDSDGRVTWDTQIHSLQAQRHLYFKDVPAYIAELKSLGVYTIGRVVCFNDPYLPLNEPDRAVLDDRPGKQGQVWATWGHRNPWLDPYNTRNHDLIVEMAKEVQALGLDEIQFDYIRFPVDRATRFARFPAKTSMPKRQVLVSMLTRVDEAIDIPIGTDVFGVSAFHEGDAEGLGQVPEAWAPYVEVFTPMLYVDGMRSWNRNEKVSRAEHLILAGIKNLRRRLGKGPVIRPFLQAYARNADYYNAAFIAEQVRGAREGGADGFLFWSPGSTYSMVQAAMGGAWRNLLPFPIDARLKYRARHWPKPSRDADGPVIAAAPETQQEQDAQELDSQEPQDAQDAMGEEPDALPSSAQAQPVDAVTKPSVR